MSNVYSVPFGEIRELEDNDPVADFMENQLLPFCEAQGIDTSTVEYRHKAAVIMTQLQVIVRGL